MSTIETIAKTLLDIAAPGMKRKDLIAAVKERHPQASKKEIVRAAFYALTDHAGAEKAPHLHEFALSERAVEDEDDRPISKPRVKSKRKGAKAAAEKASPEKAAPEQAAH